MISLYIFSPDKSPIYAFKREDSDLKCEIELYKVVSKYKGTPGISKYHEAEFRFYIYNTNLDYLIIMISKDFPCNEDNFKRIEKELHNAIKNPFYEPFDVITSQKFDDNIYSIIESMERRLDSS